MKKIQISAFGWAGMQALAILIVAVPPAVGVDGSAHQHNWPQWRGPSGNGLVSTGNPPSEWSESSNVKWKVRIPGRGNASPVVWGDKLFILTAVPGETPVQPAAETAPQQAEEQTRGRRGGGGSESPKEEYAFKVMCLDRETGKVLWEKVAQRSVPHQGIHGDNTYSSGSPVTDGERLFVDFGSYGLFCYDFNGNLIWHRDLAKVDVKFGEASSPALAGDVLVVVQDSNNGSYVAGFDKRTGEPLWKKERDEGSGWTTPYVLEHAGKLQVVVNGSNAVRSYDPLTGDVIWECSGLGANPIPMIVADHDTVYAMSGHREPAAMAITLGRTGNLTDTDAVKWKINRGTPYVSSPLLYDGLLFFCQRTSGQLTCLDARTGQTHYEQERIEGVGGVYASPIGANDRIYLSSQNGTVVILEKSSELKVVASNTLEDGFDASPAVADDELFLRGREHLYCIASQ